MNFNEFLAYFGAPKIPSTQLGKKYFLISDRQLELDKLTDKDLYYAGMFLGKQTKHGFTPSFMLLEKILPHTEKKILIDDNAEFLFSCGRDLLGSSLMDYYNFDVDTLVLVCNKHKECLGMGKIILPPRLKDRIVVKNILDRGDFLRREKH